MKQFGKILSFELKNYLKNKVFIGITVVLILVIAVVMNIPRITSLLETENEPPSEDRPVMLVQGQSPEQTQQVLQVFTPVFADYHVQSTEESVESIRERIVSGDVECAFVLDSPSCPRALTKTGPT